MKLNKLYESILAFAGIHVDDKGYAYTLYKTHREPFHVKGMPLALPYTENLKNFQPGEMIIFHPLSENIAQGESEIIEKLRYAINIKLNYTFGLIAQSLLLIVHNVAMHKKLSPDQTDLVIDLSSVDQTSMEKFTSLMLASIKSSPDSCFLNLFLKRGARVFDKKYSRAGIVNFNLYNELKEDKETVAGVKLRAKDRELFLQLYRYIFPNIDKAQSYDYGSESHTAPFLDALMKTALNLAGRFNDLLELFSNEIDMADQLVFDADWVSYFDNLDALLPEIRRIPMQQGNEGRLADAPAAAPQALQTPAGPVTYVPPAYPSPVQNEPMVSRPSAQAPTQGQSGLVKSANGALDFTANVIQKQAARGYGVQPQYAPPPFQNQAAMPQQGYPNPGYPPVGFQQPGAYPPPMNPAYQAPGAYPPPGYPQQGFPQQGYPQQGFPQQQYIPPNPTFMPPNPVVAQQMGFAPSNGFANVYATQGGYPPQMQYNPAMMQQGWNQQPAYNPMQQPAALR